MKFNITYSLFNDPDTTRGAYETDMEAATEDKAIELFDRFYPQAFLKTIEPVTTSIPNEFEKL